MDAAELEGNYVIVCAGDELDATLRTVFLGVFAPGVARNSMQPDRRLDLLGGDLYAYTHGAHTCVVDNNALFLPVISLTPLLGSPAREGLLDDFLHPPSGVNVYDAVRRGALTPQLYLACADARADYPQVTAAAACAHALRIMVHSHLIGRTSCDGGTGGDARRATLLAVHRHLRGGHEDVTITALKSSRTSSYPVSAVRAALNYQPPTARLNQLRDLATVFLTNHLD